MKTQIIFYKLISRTFNLVKVNMILLVPFLMFLLLVVVVLLPVSAVNPFIMVAILALKGVFLSGWLNMFHMCLENTYNENLTDEQKTLSSLTLYKEFFPGVGKYFQKMFWGILILIFFINLVETVIFHFMANIKSFPIYNLSETINSRTDFMILWNKISHADKMKIFKLLAVDMSFITIFSYFTMFWTQFIIVEDKKPLEAFFGSIKAVLNDPLNTFLIFLFTLISLFSILILNFVLNGNAISQLVILMLFSYVIVYYTMMSFLYFERYR